MKVWIKSMFIIRRLIILVAPILFFVWLALVRFGELFLIPGAAVFLAYLVFACFVVCGGRLSKVFAHFLILPIGFSLAVFFFVLFVINELAFYVAAVFGAMALYLVLRQYFVYFFLPLRYQAYSLESLNFYITLLSAFFLFSSGFAGVILLQLNLAIMALIILPIFALLLYQFFWIHKINIQKSWLYLLPICLIIIELFVVLAYLPTSYYVGAFVLAIMAYVMLGLSRLYVQGLLDKKKIWSFLTVGSVVVVAVLATAKWG